MKVQLTFVLAIAISSALFANHNDPVSVDPPAQFDFTSTSLTFNKIFFTDDDNDVLFIDFEAIQDQLTELNILRDDQLMMTDDVSDLPVNVIYEINLDIMRSGNYTIELVTADGIKIHKEIWVE